LLSFGLLAIAIVALTEIAIQISHGWKESQQEQWLIPIALCAGLGSFWVFRPFLGAPRSFGKSAGGVVGVCISFALLLMAGDFYGNSIVPKYVHPELKAEMDISFGRTPISGAGAISPAQSPLPPVVIKTVPESGASGIDPSLKEIRVTFSKPMQDKNWSWTKWGEGNFPEMTGDPKYLEDGRTCILPVRLQPGRVYATWLNSEFHKNFTDRDGQAAMPYLLVFETHK
jgi:hypothetical protein